MTVLNRMRALRYLWIAWLVALALAAPPARAADDLPIVFVHGSRLMVC